MYKNKKIAVVVPCYNEEKLIERVIRTMPEFVDSIFLIDDASKDGTVAKIKEVLNVPEFGKFKLILHEKNQGVGGAIVTGYFEAIQDKAYCVAVMAGDAQMDPSNLSALLDLVIEEGVDYAKGNRLITGQAWEKIPHIRYLGNAFLSLLTKIASGYWHVADSQTGYTVIKRKSLELLPIKTLYKRYGYPNHMLVLLNVFNMRVRDIPVTPVYNIGETSGIKLYKVIPLMSFLLFRQFFWRMKEKYIIRDFHPLIFFYFMAGVLLCASVPLTARIFWFWYQIDDLPRVNIMTVIFLLIMGFQSLFFGMWFDMESNRYLK